MSFALALIYILTCGYLVWNMVKNRSLIYTHLGVIGLFSIGYYPLPVVFKSISSLAPIGDEKIFSALFLHYLFLISIITGVVYSTGVWKSVPKLNFGALDNISFANKKIISFVCFLTYLIYVATTPRTSYDAQDFDDFFLRASPFRAIISAIAGLAIGFICISYATSYTKRQRQFRILCLIMVMSVVALALPLGQRLAAIAPFFILFAAVSCVGRTQQALRVLMAGVIFLLIVSPFSVFLRGARRDITGDFLSASEVVGQYKLSSNPVAQSFQSIIDRSDLIFNTIFMKEYIDKEGYASFKYYYSVLVAPIPRIIYPDKPYILSSDGTFFGEISNKAWFLLFGNIGSLTAFGGLTAYQEGGWIGVVLDGVADGMLFALLAEVFGGGGFLARVLYTNFFVEMSVQKAPPCFFESLANVAGHLPLILVMLFVALLPIYKRSKRSDEIGDLEGPADSALGLR